MWPLSKNALKTLNRTTLDGDVDVTTTDYCMGFDRGGGHAWNLLLSSSHELVEAWCCRIVDAYIGCCMDYIMQWFSQWNEQKWTRFDLRNDLVIMRIKNVVVVYHISNFLYIILQCKHQNCTSTCSDYRTLFHTTIDFPESCFSGDESVFKFICITSLDSE